MSFKKFILVLLVVFVLTSSVSIVSAERVSVSGISFDVPDNYSVNKVSDDSCILKSNISDNYTISIVLSEDSNLNVTKNSRISAGFNFISEENFNSTNDISVYKQNFVRNESYSSFYTFDVDGSSYLIIYNFPVFDDLDNQDNPVGAIIDSIQ